MSTLPGSEIAVETKGTVHIVHSGELHLHFHFGDDELTAKLDQVLANQAIADERIQKMSVELDQLEAQAKTNEDAEAAAVTMLKSLADQINSMKNDPARLTKLTSDLKARADALGAAIVAGTPAGDSGGTASTGTGTGTSGGSSGTSGGTSGGTGAGTGTATEVGSA